MPWMETGAVNERMKFVVDYQRGLPMTVLCRRHGVSRKTGYKWVKRFEEHGAEGLADRCRAPHSCSHAVAPKTVALLVDAKKRHPYWGPKKVTDQLVPPCGVWSSDAGGGFQCMGSSSSSFEFGWKRTRTATSRMYS